VTRQPDQDRVQAALATALARQSSVPSRAEAAWFRLRSFRHIALRGLRNLFDPSLKRWNGAQRLGSAPIQCEVKSDLWRDGRTDEFPLVAGKVENLRIAVRAFDGVEVDEGQILSFWKQLGPPNRLRGFVEGREIREGCVVPTIAGGLCQLSNALVRAANEAGITIVERHGHTARIEEAGSDIGDATIFWNYLDLRLSAPFPFRLEVQLTSDTLIVRIRANKPKKSDLDLNQPLNFAGQHPLAARGCLTCEQVQCFRNRDFSHLPKQGRTAVLLNTWSPEFETWLQDEKVEGDSFAPWVRRVRRKHGSWSFGDAPVYRSILAGLYRTFLLRFNPGGGKRQAALIMADQKLATTFANQLKPHHTHLIIDQSLAVPLLRAGALGGRTYDVFAHALPAEEIQSRLDAAWRASPSNGSLNDFRVDTEHCALEKTALRGATRIITAHAQVHDSMIKIGAAPVQRLAWHTSPQPHNPGSARHRERGQKPVIGFPASTLPRKGAIEMALSARELGWSVIIGGTADLHPALWQGIDVRRVSMSDPEWLNMVDLVVLPAHIEHAPRMLLQALERGIPVVASAACGLPSDAGHIEIPAGDMALLTSACRAALSACPTKANMVDAH
jgi:hypothetical protein